jgi:hypothetical protein
MSLMSGALGTHGHTSEAKSHGARGDARALPHQEAGLEPQDTWRHRSPSLLGDEPSAMGNVVTLESSCTGKWVWSRGTCGDTKALPCRMVAPVARGMWRRQSPPALGDGSGAMRHVVTLKRFPAPGAGLELWGHVATPEPFPAMCEV